MFCLRSHPGVLYMKKKSSTRVSLQNAIVSHVSQRDYNNITFQNAELVHFKCSE